MSRDATKAALGGNEKDIDSLNQWLNNCPHESVPRPPKRTPLGRGLSALDFAKRYRSHKRFEKINSNPTKEEGLKVMANARAEVSRWGLDEPDLEANRDPNLMANMFVEMAGDANDENREQVVPRRRSGPRKNNSWCCCLLLMIPLILAAYYWYLTNGSTQIDKNFTISTSRNDSAISGAVSSDDSVPKKCSKSKIAAAVGTAAALGGAGYYYLKNQGFKPPEEEESTSVMPFWGKAITAVGGVGAYWFYKKIKETYQNKTVNAGEDTTRQLEMDDETKLRGQTSEQSREVTQSGIIVVPQKKADKTETTPEFSERNRRDIFKLAELIVHLPLDRFKWTNDDFYWTKYLKSELHRDLYNAFLKEVKSSGEKILCAAFVQARHPGTPKTDLCRYMVLQRILRSGGIMKTEWKNMDGNTKRPTSPLAQDAEWFAKFPLVEWSSICTLCGQFGRWKNRKTLGNISNWTNEPALILEAMKIRWDGIFIPEDQPKELKVFHKYLTKVRSSENITFRKERSDLRKYILESTVQKLQEEGKKTLDELFPVM